jgi:hypothetical protein
MVLDMGANPRNKLTAKQIEFVHLHFYAGLTIGKAYLKAFHDTVINWSSRTEKARLNMACTFGGKLLRNHDVQRYYLHIQEKASVDAQKSRFLSFEEKRDFLAQVVRTPLEDVDESHPIAQEVTYGADGSRKIKTMDKHKAIELDARLMGEFQDTVRMDISEKVIKLTESLA